MSIIWTGIANFFDGLKKQRRRDVADVVSFLQSDQQDHKRRKVTSTKKDGGSSNVPVRLEREIMSPVMDWLEDDKVNAIGIYGMGGVGKTTLMKQLHNRLLNRAVGRGNKSGIGGIAWVSVGMNFTIYSIQHHIAEEVGLDLQYEKDVTRRSARLYAFLVRLSWDVIFLDDLWGEFQVDQVGIPAQCKLILISRSLHVCRALRCQRVIKVCPLPQDEAWELFYRNVSNSMLDTKDILLIGKRLCDICGGVPFAINGLAQKMSGVVDASGWSGALDSIIRFPAGNDAKLGAILDNLRRSYDNLISSKLKACLLYCALYPMGDAIRKEELIRVWIGEALIDDVESLQAQYDMGHSILNKLLNSCLLESIGESETMVKIHDLIKLMALSIAGDSFSVSNTPQLTKQPLESGSCEKIKVISLIKSTSPSVTLASVQKCPTLSTLLLQHSNLFELPDSIFMHMSSLQVLNLSHTSIDKLPSSTSELHKLRLLDISHCPNLSTVPSVAKLEKLRYLNLCQTPIKQVPRGFHKLEMLTEFSLYSSFYQPNIAWGKLLPLLPCLKRLSCGIVHSINLQSLKSLEILDTRFATCTDLTEYVRSCHWRMLKSFHLQVGHSRNCTQPYTKTVSLNGCSLNGQVGKSIAFPDNIQEFNVDRCQGLHNFYQNSAFSSLETVTIRRCHDVEQLLTVSSIQKLLHLQSIEIEDCEQLKEVISCDIVEESSPLNFPCLRRLVLSNLPQLNSICKTQCVYAAISYVSVTDCPRLEHTFLSSE